MCFDEEKDQRVNAGLFQFIFLGTVIVVSLCAYIEYLNYKAGGLLPLNSKPIPGTDYIPGWRDFPVDDVELVARLVAIREGDISLSEKPYTDAFRKKMDAVIEEKSAENDVMAWAQGLGLLIYPMAPILIFCKWLPNFLRLAQPKDLDRDFALYRAEWSGFLHRVDQGVC